MTLFCVENSCEIETDYFIFVINRKKIFKTLLFFFPKDKKERRETNKAKEKS